MPDDSNFSEGSPLDQFPSELDARSELVEPAPPSEPGASSSESLELPALSELDAFASESVEPPAPSDVDLLLDAVSSGGRKGAAPAGNTSITRRPFHIGTRLTPAIRRWVMPAAAAFLIGAVAGVWSFRTLDHPQAPVSVPSKRTAITVLQSQPIEPGRQPGSPPGLARPALPRETSLTEPAALLAEMAPASTERPAAARVATTQAPPPVDAPRDASIVIPVSPTPAAAAIVSPLMIPAPAILPAENGDSNAPLREPESAAVDRAALTPERDRVLRILQVYEQAFEGLDVTAAAEIWPSVDRRALSRAFATLKSQGLNFDLCEINVVDSSATARCDGTVQFVRRVGSQEPLTAEQHWVFRMRKLGTVWMIEEVTASPRSSPEARTRGEL